MSDSPEEAGSFGEMIINNTFKLKKYKEQELYLFKDVYIEDERCVHQIDSVLIMKTGIFVIETKMFSNSNVYGEDEDTYWYGSGNGYQIQFYNPILQNESHVHSVKHLLGYDYGVHSVVVFAWNNKPKTCRDPHVLNYKEFVNYPLNFIPKEELSHDDMDIIRHIFLQNEEKKAELKRKHREQIKRLKNK